MACNLASLFCCFQNCLDLWKSPGFKLSMSLNLVCPPGFRSSIWLSMWSDSNSNYNQVPMSYNFFIRHKKIEFLPPSPFFSCQYICQKYQSLPKWNTLGWLTQWVKYKWEASFATLTLTDETSFVTLASDRPGRLWRLRQRDRKCQLRSQPRHVSRRLRWTRFWSGRLTQPIRTRFFF